MSLLKLENELPPGTRVIGLDIGGTKCAVSCWSSGRLEEMVRIPTGEVGQTFPALMEAAAQIQKKGAAIIGVSCGGPLDPQNGRILEPPNLPRSWHGIPICRWLEEQLGSRAWLMNDANACALAEWKFGAGTGCRHMVFLTSGTGMGAGLILNGELYEGASGDAGEIGHVRLRQTGPMGYGKAGSVEGFCSGGGVARLAAMRFRRGPNRPSWLTAEGGPTLQALAVAARLGDDAARELLREAGEHLGEMLAILVDLFNPERIVLGGFYPRCRDLLDEAMRDVLEREALAAPLRACQIRPAVLGDAIGSHGAVAAALYQEQRSGRQISL